VIGETRAPPTVAVNWCRRLVSASSSPRDSVATGSAASTEDRLRDGSQCYPWAGRLPAHRVFQMRRYPICLCRATNCRPISPTIRLYSAIQVHCCVKGPSRSDRHHHDRGDEGATDRCRQLVPSSPLQARRVTVSQPAHPPAPRTTSEAGPGMAAFQVTTRLRCGVVRPVFVGQRTAARHRRLSTGVADVAVATRRLRGGSDRHDRPS